MTADLVLEFRPTILTIAKPMLCTPLTWQDKHTTARGTCCWNEGNWSVTALYWNYVCCTCSGQMRFLLTAQANDTFKTYAAFFTRMYTAKKLNWLSDYWILTFGSGDHDGARLWIHDSARPFLCTGFTAITLWVAVLWFHQNRPWDKQGFCLFSGRSCASRVGNILMLTKLFGILSYLAVSKEY